MNSGKTKHVVVDTPKSKNLGASLNLRVGAASLKGMECYDYLGVMLDNCLSFRQQIARTVENVARDYLHQPKSDNTFMRE